MLRPMRAISPYGLTDNAPCLGNQATVARYSRRSETHRHDKLRAPRQTRGSKHEHSIRIALRPFGTNSRMKEPRGASRSFSSKQLAFPTRRTPACTITRSLSERVQDERGCRSCARGRERCRRRLPRHVRRDQPRSEKLQIAKRQWCKLNSVPGTRGGFVLHASEDVA